ncbi:MAG: F0F1 ATP synthase subunit alpha [Planctomycetota bacterium]|nr:F0F1 ATP synthase subunit alpha [Planctomycetota bacterium]
MKFNPDEIASVIRSEIANYRREVDVSHVGRVLEVGDGIAHIYGLAHVMSGEMIEFDNGVMGQAFNLAEGAIGAVIYGDCAEIREGMNVRGTGKLLEVPVGKGMLGRVVDALGRPMDGGPAIKADAFRPVEMPATGLIERQPVNEPLQTGIKAVDTMLPIGRGQRELIIGDRKTGKTAIAVDTIINQRGTGVMCVYVAIGQKESTVAAVVETLRAHGAMDYTVVVAASSSDPAPMQYVAPYSGCTIAEHFMEQGGATLVVYDDLTKQAAAYREISLLLRRPPGREAYPGDVFYLHSRLLERACKRADMYVLAPSATPEGATGVAGADGHTYIGPHGLIEIKAALEKRSDKASLKIHRLGDSGGSMTALPVCETQEGEVSAYIPTNLISITDGQIYLEPSLFFAGVRPAVNVGISVSRVGYKAAVPAIKTVAKSLRLDLASYRELESFTKIGMELDAATQRRLDRGARLVKLLTQPQYRPMSVMDQTISIHAGNSGALDDLAVADVSEFEAALLAHVKENEKAFYAELSSDMSLPGPRAKQLNQIIAAFKAGAWKEIVKKRSKAVLTEEAAQ